ncbi:MAG: LPD7 domain-containing protein [Gammaproteobacteria bacterium]
MPEIVHERYYSIDNRWFLDSGEEAFVNHGDRLTTKSENRQIVRDLIEIARENRAEAITVTGTEAFRKTAWREAQRAGLRVEGYAPTQHDEKQFVREMARERAAQRGGGADARADSERTPDRAAPEPTETPARPRRQSRDSRAAGDGASGERAAAEPSGRQAETARTVKDRFYYGELLEHGAENYKWNPQEDMSYFVKIGTSTGVQELWGKDLERALRESKSRPQVGEQIGVRQTGQQSVTVQERELDDAGNIVGEKEKHTHRNAWLIEKREFFEERARIARTVRDPAVPAREAVARHPQLVGTELVLKQAEEFAKTLNDPATREAFLAALRNTVADEIARGQPLRTTRVRTPEARAASRSSRTPPDRAAERTLV